MVKTAILFVVMLLILVIPHEWGHLIVAKLCGVKVNEFSVGMGPLLFKKQKGETQYSVRLLPLGGYCAMEGEESAVDDPRSYSSKTPLQKIAILLAGVTMNVIIAILVITLAYAISGMPSNTLSAITPDSPAAAAGIQAGDKIIQIDGADTRTWDDVITAIDGYHEGDKMEIVYKRDGKTYEAFLTPEYDKENQRYMVGIQMGYVLFRETKTVRRGPIEAFVKTCGTSWKMTTSIFRYFKRMFQGQVKMDAFSGPVSIVAVMGNVWMSGFQDFLMLLALISINLGVMNLLPLAITDGGLLMFLGLEKLRGKPLSTKTQTVIQNVAAAFFISFFVFITILDFGKLSLFLK